MGERLYTKSDLTFAKEDSYQAGYYMGKQNTPWEEAFNRMESKEKEIILKIADQLGKKHYFNAINEVGKLLIECIEGLQELINK